MDSTKYLNDITEIKSLMNRSSRFISLSGLSGILAGIYALIGAAFAYWFANNNQNGVFFFQQNHSEILIIDILLVGAFSIGTAIFLTTKKAKKNNQKIWDSLTRRLLINFITPLATGGIYILVNLYRGNYEQTEALMLIFYGLGLFNASKYTLGDIKYLGYTQIILGLICSMYPNYGFWFWVLGFGIMHIVYGTVMHFKYGS